MTMQKVAFGEVCDFVRGVSFDGDDAIDVPQKGYVPILRAGNIGDELYVHDDLVWVPEERVSKEQYFQVGDIAICMASGSPAVLGKTAQLKESFVGSVGAFCGIIRPTKADPNFIAYWLKSSDFMTWRDSQANGVNIQNLRPNEIREIEIPLPPLTEQKRIASLLRRADRLRQMRRTAHDLSDALLQSVFLDMFGDGSKFDRVEFEEILEESPKNGLYLSSDQYGSGTPIIRIDAFYDGVLGNPAFFKRLRATPKQIEEFNVQNDEILINRVNSLEYLGKCALVKGLLETTLFESNMMRIRINRKLANPVYVTKYLTTPEAYAQIMQKAKKAVNQASINQQDVKSIVIPVPPLSLQEKFAGVVARVESLRGRMGESTRQVDGLFESVLSESFGG
jgi:type I restriction enzyme S subunit